MKSWLNILVVLVLAAGAAPARAAVEHPLVAAVGLGTGGGRDKSEYDGNAASAEFSLTFRRWDHWSFGARRASNRWIRYEHGQSTLTSMEFLVRWFPWTGRTMPYAGVQFGTMTGRVNGVLPVSGRADDYDAWGTQYGGGFGVQHWVTDRLGGYAEAMLAGVIATGTDFGFWRLTAGVAVRF